MPGTESTNRAQQGFRRPEVDVEALVDAAQELAGGPNGAGRGSCWRSDTAPSGSGPSRPTAVRAAAGARGCGRLRGQEGAPPLLRWYVEPFAAGQRMFNSVVLKLVDGTLSRRSTAATAVARRRAVRTLARARGAADARRARGAAALRARADRRRAAGAAAFPDYFAFEAGCAARRATSVGAARLRRRLPRRRSRARRRLRSWRAARPPPRRRDRGARRRRRRRHGRLRPRRGHRGRAGRRARLPGDGFPTPAWEASSPARWSSICPRPCSSASSSWQRGSSARGAC